jgi:uncharacterized membrane protein (DUF373 family)
MPYCVLWRKKPLSEHEEPPASTATAATASRASSLLSAIPKHKKEGHEAIEEGWAAVWLERGDRFIYGLVGACFFLGALFALGYAFYNFFHQLNINYSDPANIAQAIINLVSDLLLVLIIMEVMGTVLHYLRERATSLKPFLFIGMISATRGVLAIGARLSVTQVKGEEFNNAMIELGVNAAVILALGITLRVLSKYGTTDAD